MNNVKTIKASGNCFIIPNKAVRVDDPCWIRPDESKATIQRIFELNNMEFDPDCKMVEVWVTSSDLNTDNLSCHAGEIIEETDGKKYIIGADIYYIPSTFLERRKEGSVIKFFIDGWMREDNSTEAEDIILELDLKLDQLNSRYCRCGEFQNAFKLVTAE